MSTFKYGKFSFDANQQLVRRAGSDWLRDTKNKLRKVRAWKPAEGRWDLTGVGKAYYGKHGSELVVSVPVHYMILRRRQQDTLQYRGYMPVSQLTTSLKHRLERALQMERGRARTNILEAIKTTVLKELDATGETVQVEIDGQEAQVYPIHYESDMTAVFRPTTPRPMRYSQLKLTDGKGDEIEVPMRAAGTRPRPHILRAADISPYSLEDSGSVNCAVYALSRHLEIPEEEVQADMEALFRKHTQKSETSSVVRLWYSTGVRASDHATSSWPMCCIPPSEWTPTNAASASLGPISTCGSTVRAGALLQPHQTYAAPLRSSYPVARLRTCLQSATGGIYTQFRPGTMVARTWRPQGSGSGSRVLCAGRAWTTGAGLCGCEQPATPDRASYSLWTSAGQR